MLYPRVDGTIVKPHHACEQLWVNAISKYKVTYQFSWPTSCFLMNIQGSQDLPRMLTFYWIKVMGPTFEQAWPFCYSILITL
jgi:hypothetical protein